VRHTSDYGAPGASQAFCDLVGTKTLVHPQVMDQSFLGKRDIDKFSTAQFR
jgi:hypothetical protein